MKRLATLLVAICFLGLATAASGATVWTDPAHPKRVYLQAEPGEANHVRAWKRGSELIISDAHFFTIANPLGDANPCTLVKPNTPGRVKCGGHVTLVADLGDEDDTLVYRIFDRHFRVSAVGGDGTDVLRGGAGRDRLEAEVASGAPGNDTLIASVLAHGGLGLDRCRRAHNLTTISCERLT